MDITPVLFEDHTLAHFRPLTWSLPTYEVRVGMFSLRERMGHLAGAAGLLLGRSVLADLHRASSWTHDFSEAAQRMAGLDQRFLWINGRVDWSHQQLKSLRDRVSSGSEVEIQDQHGFLAFSCPGDVSIQVLASWRQWEKAVAEKGGWAAAEMAIPTWRPELPGGESPAESGQALQWIWEIVPHTPAALLADLEWLKPGGSYSRQPFGVTAAPGAEQPVWARPSSLKVWDQASARFEPGQVAVNGEENFWCGPEVQLGSGVAIDASGGPVILDRGVNILPNCYLEGPLYMGPGSTVKAGANIYGESSFGILNKIAGEIAESTFGDFTNKQHEGFIGHAVLGAWVNLGAMTTCSDLKNNYGNVRVDLGTGPIESGQRFVGLLMADHAKTAIGTLFNTGTSVGFASNIFGGGMPPKFVGNFNWGGQAGGPGYAVGKALATAEVVMARRGCQLSPGHETLFRHLAG